jgi:hypothetical protein
MGWFVRYIDDELKHEMVSRELATEEEALEEAWNLAQGDNEVVGIDGPDEESVPMVEIEASKTVRQPANRGLRPNVATAGGQGASKWASTGSEKWPVFDPATATHAAFFFGAINLRLTKTSAI